MIAILSLGCIEEQYIQPPPPEMPTTQFINQGRKNSANLTEGSSFAFGDGKYTFRAAKLNLSSDLGCSDTNIEYTINKSEISKLMLCQGYSQTWLSPDNRNFWISYVSKGENWIEIEITG